MGKKSYHLRSMTAYGRAEKAFDFGRIIVEITTLNRRHLEIHLSAPRLLSHLEHDLRKKMGASIARGQVNASVSWQFEGKKPIRLIPNLELAKELKKGWEEIGDAVGMPFDLSLLKASRDQLFFEQPVKEEISVDVVLTALDEALEKLQAMKENEGETLAIDLAMRAQKIQHSIEMISKVTPEASEKFRKKLCERVGALSSDTDERILKEIAIYAEKIDVSEEIVRFQSHLGQIFELLEQKLDGLKEVKGKTLDFLLQELMREINTIGAKVSLISVAKEVIEVKSELEKMREQVQNVE
ncbi:MAG: hypothetical protein S4CHLAM45_02400 [Chlamydiales bacterium]|nr:hypothetical protein [Chlamydiales bacterium]MCH9619099.1 hypothetical protein [Chlamydiales bacterium]MCH9622361.1 hypothetical protein [Chlamydiales bacterium]